MNKDRFLVTGPSGCGKTTLMDRFGTDNRSQFINLDLDQVGFRNASDDQNQATWVINPDALKLLCDNATNADKHLVVAGCSTNFDDLVKEAYDLNFVVLCLLPPADVIQYQREKRGDATWRLVDVDLDVQAWEKLVSYYNITTYETPDEIYHLILAGCSD